MFFAQTELPSFPIAPPTLSLPDAPQLPSIPLPQSGSFPQASSSAALQRRFVKILGFKKVVQVESKAASVALPPFPSTAPIAASATTEPTIACSSGLKCETSPAKSMKFDSAVGQTVVLASAQETASDETISTQAEEESSVTDESLVDSLSSEESLIDIEIPAPLAVPATAPAQRLPEIVKRPPAMQLHIGGSSKPTAASVSANQDTTFSLSDSEGSHSVSIADHKGIHSPVVALPSNPMKIQIEGEPGTGQAIPKATSALTTDISTVASTNSDSDFGEPASRAAVTGVPVVSAPVTSAPVNSLLGPTPSSVASQTQTTKERKSTPSLAASSRVAGQKSVANKVTENAPVIGEQLDVGLHEATNVETVQPISGLSIEHPELCQVLKSGERTLSLVGLKPGKTRVALFTTNEAGERKIEIREVVIAGTESRQTDIKTMAAEISNTVHSMYPNSRIEIIAEAEGLTVQGYAGSEDEAKKIIGLVRRTSLQPVVDRLATYK